MPHRTLHLNQNEDDYHFNVININNLIDIEDSSNKYLALLNIYGYYIYLSDEDIQRLHLYPKMYITIETEDSRASCVLLAPPKDNPLLQGQILLSYNLKKILNHPNTCKIIPTAPLQAFILKPTNQSLVSNKTFITRKLFEELNAPRQIEIASIGKGHRAIIDVVPDDITIRPAQEYGVRLTRDLRSLIGLTDNTNIDTPQLLVLPKNEIPSGTNQIQGYFHHMLYRMMYKRNNLPTSNKSLRFMLGLLYLIPIKLLSLLFSLSFTPFILLIRPLLLFIVGTRKIKLQVTYPDVMDEENDIVRVHSQILKILGLNEGDKVTISYNNTAIEHTVFQKYENYYHLKPTLEDLLSIGIPVKTREKLGLLTLDTVIEIERNMGPILWRHICKQILPLAAVMIALNPIINTIVQKFHPVNDAPLLLYYGTIYTIIFLILLFISLTEERSKIK